MCNVIASYDSHTCFVFHFRHNKYQICPKSLEIQQFTYSIANIRGGSKIRSKFFFLICLARKAKVLKLTQIKKPLRWKVKHNYNNKNRNRFWIAARRVWLLHFVFNFNFDSHNKTIDWNRFTRYKRVWLLFVAHTIHCVRLYVIKQLLGAKVNIIK